MSKTKPNELPQPTYEELKELAYRVPHLEIEIEILENRLELITAVIYGKLDHLDGSDYVEDWEEEEEAVPPEPETL